MTNAKKYKKQSFLASATFKNRRDMIAAVLDEEKSYTLKEAEALIKRFMERMI